MFTEESLQDFFEIAELLSGGDQAIYQQLKTTVFATQPEEIIDLLLDTLQETDFDYLFEQFGKSQVENAWWILLYLLKNKNYLCIWEQEDELAELPTALSNLSFWKETGLKQASIEKAVAGKTSISSVLEDLGGMLSELGYLFGRIDMQSETSYLFLCPRTSFYRLRTLAENLGYRVK